MWSIVHGPCADMAPHARHDPVLVHAHGPRSCAHSLTALHRLVSQQAPHKFRRLSPVQSCLRRRVPEADVQRVAPLAAALVALSEPFADGLSELLRAAEIEAAA
jgi:hypothetical protein